jgi:hypothetical protein
MPRYPSLIDYKPSVDGLQLEPAFGILDPNLRRIVIDVSIAAKERVVFEEDKERPGAVQCWSIDRPSRTEVPGVVANELIGAKHCRLLWDPSQAERDVTVLRLFCRHENEVRSRSQASAEVYTEIEGGVYVVLQRRSARKLLKPKPIRKEAALLGRRGHPTIQVLGFDAWGRTIFDVFKDTGELPREVELAPAFRVREGELLTVDFLLRLEDLVFEVAGRAGKLDLDLDLFAPGAAIPELRARLEADPHVCRVEYRRLFGKTSCPQSVDCDCMIGRAISFRLSVGGRGRDHIPPAAVVEPPSCSPNGVCGPPPDDSMHSP